MSQRRRRRAWQHTLWDEPIYSHRAATTHIGAFFEELVAKLFKGERVTVEGSGDDWNPDVILDGVDVEVKASNRGSWMLGATQIRQMANSRDSWVALVRYESGGVNLWKVKTLGALHQIISHAQIEIWCVPSGLISARAGELTRRECWGGSRIVRTLPLKKVKEWCFSTAEQDRIVAGAGLLLGQMRSSVRRNVRVCGAVCRSIRLWNGLEWRVSCSESDSPF